MRGDLCGKRTSMLTAINCCTVDHQSLIALHQSSIQQPDICRESRFLPTALVFDASVRGSPSEYRYNVWYGKTRMAWLPGGVNSNIVDMFIRFDRIHERDEQTDGRADRRTPHRRHGPRLCIASRGKNL